MHPNKIDTDYKASVIAAGLIETGAVSPDQVVIYPLGYSKRAYSKEIAGIEPYYSDNKRTDCLAIKIHREGLYDMLPDGLFHHSPTAGIRMSEADMIQDLLRRREEEKEARRFFIPFEAELNHFRIFIEVYENRLDQKTSYADLINIFSKEWNDFTWMELDQANIILHILPYLHQKRNNYAYFRELLEVLLKHKVSLETGSPGAPGFTGNTPAGYPDLTMKLGAGQLGLDTLIGTVAPEEDVLRIKIGPLKASEALHFLPGTKNARLLDLLVSYFIPLDTEVITDLLIHPREHRTSLGEEEANACMGYTTFL